MTNNPPRKRGMTVKGQYMRAVHHPRRRDTKAVIDIGSNSIKLRVVRREKNGLQMLVDTTEVVRLGNGMEAGRMREDAMRHGVNVILRLARIAWKMGARPTLVGTMVLRTATNAASFVTQVKQHGLSLRILSGREEARLAWLGAIHGLSAGSGSTVVFDTGGGSTEFVFGNDGVILDSVSVPVGAVRVTERFFTSAPVSVESLTMAQNYIVEQMRECGLEQKNASASHVIGLGGGVVAIASVKQKMPVLIPRNINGIFLSFADVEAQVKLYSSLTDAERMKIVGLPPKRADIVLASACIVKCALQILGADRFQVSINGLRHGLLVEMFHAQSERVVQEKFDFQ